MNNVIEIQEVTSKENFNEEILDSNTPVLVDFWADWCNPCKALLPTIKSIQHRYTGKLKVLKLNIDNQGIIANDYSVRSIPTLILFKQGIEIAREIGFKTENQLINFLEPHLIDSKASK